MGKVIEMKEYDLKYQTTCMFRLLEKFFKNVPYESWLRKKNLLRDFDPDMLSYNWEFCDDRVAQIAEECLKWNKKFHSVYSALRHVERTDLSSKYVHKYLLAFRRQDLDFMKLIINNIDKRDFLFDLAEKACLERINLMKNLYGYLQSAFCMFSHEFWFEFQESFEKILFYNWNIAFFFIKTFQVYA